MVALLAAEWAQTITRWYLQAEEITCCNEAESAESVSKLALSQLTDVPLSVNV